MELELSARRRSVLIGAREWCPDALKVGTGGTNGGSGEMNVGMKGEPSYIPGGASLIEPGVATGYEL